jgi:hypothetical protein
MMSFAHGLSGALIVSKVPNPAISIPLTIAVHFAEDYIPHWDFGTGLSSKKQTKKAAFFLELFIDLPLSILLVYYFFQHNQPFSPLPWIGWFFCLLPDFIEFPYLFLNWNFSPLKEYDKFHHLLHRSTPKFFLGIFPQLLIVVATALLV